MEENMKKVLEPHETKGAREVPPKPGVREVPPNNQSENSSDANQNK